VADEYFACGQQRLECYRIIGKGIATHCHVLIL
jgi:hypothetical protein